VDCAAIAPRTRTRTHKKKAKVSIWAFGELARPARLGPRFRFGHLVKRVDREDAPVVVFVGLQLADVEAAALGAAPKVRVLRQLSKHATPRTSSVGTQKQIRRRRFRRKRRKSNTRAGQHPISPLFPCLALAYQEAEDFEPLAVGEGLVEVCDLSAAHLKPSRQMLIGRVPGQTTSARARADRQGAEERGHGVGAHTHDRRAFKIKR
jgi:hypothetical protein